MNTHYQPPQIGFPPATRRHLDYMGWPNHLIHASEGEIALAYKAKQDAEKEAQQRRDNRRMFWMMVALIVPAVAVIAAQAWGWV